MDDNAAIALFTALVVLLASNITWAVAFYYAVKVLS